MLSKSEILSAADTASETVEVPEWGGTVAIRGMTGCERDAWEAWCFSKREEWGTAIGPNIRAAVLVRTIVDESGVRVFSEDDVESLGGKSGAVVDRLYGVAARLSGISAKDTDDLKKN